MIDVPTMMGTFKAMIDIAQSMLSMRDSGKINSAVIELQTKILAAQSEQMSLVSRVQELEQRISDADEWNAEKQRYTLRDFGEETFAYVLKSEASGGEPPHKLCVNCFHQRHKAVLQRQGRKLNGQDIYICPQCSKEVRLGVFNRDPPPRRSLSDF